MKFTCGSGSPGNTNSIPQPALHRRVHTVSNIAGRPPRLLRSTAMPGDRCIQKFAGARPARLDQAVPEHNERKKVKSHRCKIKKGLSRRRNRKTPNASCGSTIRGGMSLDSPPDSSAGLPGHRQVHIGGIGNDRSPDLGCREMTHVGAGWRDAEGRLGAELGGDRHRGGDVAVVEDLVKASTQELPESDTRAARIGSAEGSAGVERTVFAYGNGHAADLERFSRDSASKMSPTCGRLWTTSAGREVKRLDNCDERRAVLAPSAGSFHGCDGRRTPREPPQQARCYFLPCILTASIDAAAASGSR